MKVCFDMNHSEYQALQAVAQSHKRPAGDCAREIVLGYLKDKGGVTERGGSDRRAHPRLEVSIPAVSCVNIPDRGVHSLPVTIKDISKGGMRISFHNLDMGFADRLSGVSYFEVVFTIPETYQTVSFYCRKTWSNVSNGVSMGGGFDTSDSRPIEMLSNYMEG